jgi:hypothetical protein
MSSVPMSRATKLKAAQKAEPQKGKPGSDDLLPYFAEKASAERVKPVRGVLLGLILAAALWIGIFALVSFFRR